MSESKHKWRILRDAILRAAKVQQQADEQGGRDGTDADCGSVMRFKSFGLVSSVPEQQDRVCSKCQRAT